MLRPIVREGAANQDGGISRTLGAATRNYINMINYFNPVVDNGLILSIDNVVLDVWVANAMMRDLIESELFSLSRNDVEIITWESGKPGTFRRQCLFKLKDGTSFWLGCGLIGTGIAVERYRMEFNPNKVGEKPVFSYIHELLVNNCRKSLSRIARFDLAVDIPVERTSCFLVKDRRLYIERRHGVEFTQYLGAKTSTVGRVKLYNKAAEAKLDRPLTRLELTLDPKNPYEKMNFPTVWRLNDQKLSLDGLKVTETERFILNAILQGYGTLNDLGRKTRAKIEILLKDYATKIEFSEENYTQMLEQVDKYCK